MEIKNKSVNKGIDYIIKNLRRNLTVEEVAKHCCFSKFHFNRLFKECTGESVYSLIKRLRLEESAIFLGTNTYNSITDIALDYGYSASNYSSAFIKHHGMSPAKFRQLKKSNTFDIKNPFNNQKIIYKDFEYYNNKVTINEFKDTRIIFKRYIGNYQDMRELWPKFINEQKQVIDIHNQLIEISYNDPNITNNQRCLFELCIKLPENINPLTCANQNIKVIKGGKFASYKSTGNESQITQEYKGVFNVWLPKCGLVVDDRIRFDEYKYVDPENFYFEIDINIPIK